MNVSEAVESRYSARAFLERPVSLDLLREILRAAARAPSGGNLQPWHVYLLGGPVLEEFNLHMQQRLAESPRGETAEYPVYPEHLSEPYAARRFKVGEELYASIGILRENKAGRLQQFFKNFRFFGAPVGLFCFIDRQMGSAQWCDLGMFLQTVMLLLKERGLDSCAQEAWSLFPRSVGMFLGVAPELMLFCGMAIGYADPDADINRLKTSRAPLEDFARFRGFE